MGDARFQPFYETVVGASDRAEVLRKMQSSEVVQALAGASRAKDPYVANTLATELMNRLRRKHTLLDAATVGFLAVDLQGRITFANEYGESYLGYEHEQLLGVDICSILDGWAALTPGSSKLLGPMTELVARRRDGSQCYTDCSIGPILAPDGALEGHVVVFSDSSARRRRQRILTAEKKAFESLVHRMPLKASLEGIIAAALDGSLGAAGLVVTTGPKGVDTIAAWAPDTGKRWTQALSTTFTGREHALISRVQRTGVLEVVATSDDLFSEALQAGSTEAIVAPCSTEPSHPLGLLVIFQQRPRVGSDDGPDFAEFVARLCGFVILKRDVQKERDTFASLVEMIPDLVAVGDWNGTFHVLNPAWTKLLGWSTEELHARPYLDFVLSTDQKSVHELGMQAPKELHGYRVRHACKDGTFKWFEWTVVDHEGKAFGIGHEVTERVRKESELESQAKLQSSVARLGVDALRGAALDDIFARAVVDTAHLLGVEFAKVLQYRPESHDLILRRGFGWRTGLEDSATVPSNDGSQASYTLRTDRPVVTEDIAMESRFTAPALLVEHDVRSGISVVIYGHDRPWGVLGIHTKVRRKFTQVEVDYVQGIANVLGGALESERMRQFEPQAKRA